MKNLRTRITFTEGLLGTKSFDKEIVEEFIASKNPKGAQDDELSAVDNFDIADEVKKYSTGFSRNDKGEPIIWDYQIKGFFKDAIGMLNRTKPATSKVKAYKKVVDGLIFPEPRQIVLNLKGELEWCSRPIRIDGPNGPQTALVRSEEAPIGTTVDVDIKCLDDKVINIVKECLDYGALRGLGQWRNSGKGRFTWEELELV